MIQKSYDCEPMVSDKNYDEIPRESGFDPARGKRIKQAISDTGLSASRVSQNMDVSRTSLQNWISGAPMHTGNLYCLCKLLNKDVRYILEGAEHTPENSDLHAKIDLLTPEHREQVMLLTNALLGSYTSSEIKFDINVVRNLQAREKAPE